MRNTTSTSTRMRSWVGQRVTPPSVGTLFYSGGYVEVLYSLTGEHRAYIREAGLYDRVIPRQDAFWLKGERQAQHTRLGSMAGWAPLRLPEPQRQGDQWRRPERHHAGPELVPQPEHEGAVQLQHHQPASARVAGDADRTERRYDPGLRHATGHGLLSRPVDIEPADPSDPQI